MQLIQYVLVLILGGWVCFKHLFPMLGRWIVDFNSKLQDKMRSNGQRYRKKKNEKEKQEDMDLAEYFATESQINKILSKKQQEAQKRKDDQCVIDGLYMSQDEIERAYRGND